ncbi:sodium/potassium-transporting ATPase subunit beta-2-like [Tribolium madens]|uniref:sodium/potassium-transporting ATPase subunit beta-2-like n=1 Tax=Tribolium madens TaxID=41895 RepID=UPI001CF7638B|nr:sodium/potassium-transporting ATPase subunit beta-2-like [Tribolium madens]XP_044262423.1 sodium/potassium-transporting ATPase subunit beta-2-like [Tribolium madens]
MKISAKRLGKLLLFYSIFYVILGVFTVGMFQIFLKTLDDKAPKWQLDESLIGSNPGLTLKPSLPDNLIVYKTNDTERIFQIKQQLDNFLAPYFPEEKHENVQECKNSPNEGKVCDFVINERFSPCTRQMNYSYSSSDTGPCVFLKLNKLFGWEPELYNRTTDLPKEMPYYLQHTIKTSKIQDTSNIIWLSCVPQDMEDYKNIGTLVYYFEMGFHRKYFPFRNTEGYLSPLVAVLFEKPKRGVLIRVECKVWARNIHHDLKNNKGVVRFALLID